jgi:uncharacterized protein
MSFADIQWFYIFTSFVIGGVIGAWLYKALHTNTVPSTQMHPALTGNELELNQVRGNLNSHFSRTASNLASLSQQLKNLEEQIASDANLLCSDESIIQCLTNQHSDQAMLSNQNPPKDYASNKNGGTLTSKEYQQPKFDPPRDYVSGKAGGTLAEDFGLKPEAFAPISKKQ